MSSKYDYDEVAGRIHALGMPMESYQAGTDKIAAILRESFPASSSQGEDKPTGWPSWKAKAEEMERNWHGATETHMQERQRADELEAALASERERSDLLDGTARKLTDELKDARRESAMHARDRDLYREELDNARSALASEQAKREEEAKQIPDGLLLMVSRASYAAGHSNMLARPTRENICKAWGYTIRPSLISEYPKELDMGPESDKDCPLCGAIVRNARPAPDATVLGEALREIEGLTNEHSGGPWTNDINHIARTALLRSEPRLCTWTEDDDGNWGTSCGDTYCMEAGTPRENGYAYCPNCGSRIKYVEHISIADDEDEPREGERG